MGDYSDYYQRTIDAGALGIKLVLGPTGLGKSSRIPLVVHRNPDRKFIYIADRKQLLDEMAARFSSDECVVLRRDLETVQQVLTTQWAAFEALLADPRFGNALKQARQKSHLKSLEMIAVRRACRQILEMTATERILPSWAMEHADAQARIVLSAVRWVLQITRDAKGQGKIYNWLISHPVVEKLFPAIPFRFRSEVRIMAVTLQKAYYGFFDGVQMRSFTGLFEDKHPIIFLDEFDFLENDLVKMICRAPQISDPFDFVANFYRAMANHKLPRADFPFHPNIRRRIEKIVEIVDGPNGGIQKKGLNYPTINHFTLDKTSPHKKQQSATPAVFRTQHVIKTNPLFINPTKRSFQIEGKQSQPN